MSARSIGEEMAEAEANNAAKDAGADRVLRHSVETLPAFVELAQARIEAAGPKDRTIEIRVAINTARMMVEAESANACLSARFRVITLEAALRDAIARIEAEPFAVQAAAGLDELRAALAGT